MANSLQWSLLSAEQVSALQMDLDGQSPAGARAFRSKLAEFLGLAAGGGGGGGGGNAGGTDRKTEIMLDFHFYNVAFCKARGFTAAKTAAFCGIMHALLEEDMAAAHRDVRQSFARLKQLVLEHSVERPPWSVGVFDDADIDPMLDHAANSYFRHFRLYRINLSARVQHELEQHAPGFVRAPRRQRGLAEAIEVTGEVDELELSKEELRLVEKEVQRRMAPTLAGFQKQESAYRNIIGRLGGGEEEEGGKK
jgi:hypothetical protein